MIDKELLRALGWSEALIAEVSDMSAQLSGISVATTAPIEEVQALHVTSGTALRFIADSRPAFTSILVASE